jgi:hypothetical protein
MCDRVELARRQVARHVGVDLTARVQPQPDALAVERSLELPRPLGDAQRVERITGSSDVRGDGRLAHAVAHHPVRVRERRRLVGRTVVHPRQKVEVQVDVGHRP